MIISVASGKGGTGKTTVSTSLALSVEGAMLLDCDVEEPNSHLFIKPDIGEKENVYIPVPEVDEALCNGCGKCREICRYNAIAVLNDNVLVFEELCHGCGSCSYFCPQGAIHERDREVGVVEIGDKNGLQFIHGKLLIGTPMPTPVIKAVKKHIDPAKVNIIDVPPGTSCPVVESIKGSDYCILVTEPTPFGLHDLKLAVSVLQKMKIPFGVVINRSDLGDNKTKEYCDRNRIPLLMKIPFDRNIASAYARGVPLVEAFPDYKKQFNILYQHVRKRVGGGIKLDRVAK